MTVASSQKTKRQIRTQMRGLRRSLSDRQRRHYAERLAAVVTTQILRRGCQRIACYLPNDGEMDLTPLIARLWSLGRKSFLPVLHKHMLWFMPYTNNTPLVTNYFGIPEPDISADKRCPARALDLVLMPLVAFDESGNRLGMGGGFYDQTFSYKSRSRGLTKPHLIGVAYELQCVKQLPANWWDIGLDGIVTENGYRTFDTDTTSAQPQ